MTIEQLPDTIYIDGPNWHLDVTRGEAYIRKSEYDRLVAEAAPAPQAREITVQEAAEVLLIALERAQIDMAILKLLLNGQPAAALRAIADRERAATIEEAVRRIEPAANADDISRAVLSVAQCSIRALHTDATRAALADTQKGG